MINFRRYNLYGFSSLDKEPVLGYQRHLHSYFQHDGGWDGFHANHIADLMRLLSAQLLPMGYVTDLRESLQIRRLGDPAGKPESDVTIYDTDPVRSFESSSPTLGSVQAVAIPDMPSG